MEEKQFRGQTLVMTDGRELTLDGVVDIIGFLDGEITLECEGGTITVEGDGLKIDSLIKEGGKISVKGNITGIFRTPAKKEKRGFFEPLFSLYDRREKRVFVAVFFVEFVVFLVAFLDGLCVAVHSEARV